MAPTSFSVRWTGQVVPNEPPVIEFDPPIADMGEMISDIAETVKIKIKNVHTEPIRITKAIPGCGCTTPFGWRCCGRCWPALAHGPTAPSCSSTMKSAPSTPGPPSSC